MDVDIIDLLEEDDLNPQKVASTHGGEYASPCPFCGGNDRFRSWPETGRWWCRVCEKNGDDIAYLMEYRKMTFRAACEYLGRTDKLLYSASNYHRPRNLKRKKAEKKQSFVPKEIMPVSRQWQIKAQEFVDQSHRYLLGDTQLLKWLREKRGLTLTSIKKAKLGYNPWSRFESPKRWGYPNREDDVFIPDGLVIPGYRSGEIYRVRTRKEGRDNKFLPIAGGRITPMILKSEIDTGVYTIVESDLDAILIHQECGDLVTVVAMGSVNYKPDTYLHSCLISATAILQSFDTGKDDPAKKSVEKFWLQIYPQCVRWLCLKGKDPTESYLHGVDLRLWIQAGMKEYFPVEAFDMFDFLFEHEKSLPEELISDLDDATIERIAIQTIEGSLTDDQAFNIHRTLREKRNKV